MYFSTATATAEDMREKVLSVTTYFVTYLHKSRAVSYELCWLKIVLSCVEALQMDGCQTKVYNLSKKYVGK
jgi:hypothetical protein